MKPVFVIGLLIEAAAAVRAVQFYRRCSRG